MRTNQPWIPDGSLFVCIATMVVSASVAIAQECAWTLHSQTGPSARRNHAMAYDSNRGVVVLFGGNDGFWRADTWEWDGVEWTLRSEAGPSGRYYHTMVYDSRRGVTVLFGGYDGSPRGDTWEWDGVEWVIRSQTGPAPRRVHAMAYDSRRDVTVLFGGYFWDGSPNLLGDTWEWDGDEWTLRSQVGPGPRRDPTLAYDSARGVTVLFGGHNGIERVGDTWEWDGAAWTFRSRVGPSPRRSHAMVYDSGRGVSVLFGGWNGLRPLGDTWAWDGVEWTPGTQNGPSARWLHAMAYDSERGVTVLFSGADGTGPRDTWEHTCFQRPRLTVVATCPSGGPIRISWEGATPNRQVALIFALNTGSVAIPPPNPCAGTRLGLGANQIHLAWQGPSGPGGSRTIIATAPRDACNGYLQLLDVATCATSNVVRVE